MQAAVARPARRAAQSGMPPGTLASLGRMRLPLLLLLVATCCAPGWCLGGARGGCCARKADAGGGGTPAFPDVGAAAGRWTFLRPISRRSVLGGPHPVQKGAASPQGLGTT